MIRASQEYKRMMNSPIRNRGYVSVALGVINQEAQLNSVLSTSKVEQWTRGDVFKESTRPFVTYATLEQDFITADGTMLCMPESSGYYENGVVFTPEVRTLEIAINGPKDTYSIKGLTIDFGASYPANIAVKSGANTYNFVVDNSVFTTEEIMEVGRSVMIECSLPENTRLRVRTIKFGIGITFTNEVVEEVSLTDVVSHISDEISYKDFSITAYDVNNKFNVEDPNSFTNFLEPMQDINVSFGVDLENGQEWLQVANLKLKEWAINNQRLQIKACDKLSLLDTEYENLSMLPRTAKSEIIACLTDCGYLPDEYAIDGYLDSVFISAPIMRTTHKECLQMICNAFRSVFYEDANGVLQFKANFATVVGPTEIYIANSPQRDIAIPENTINGTEVINYAELSGNMIKADGKAVILREGDKPIDTGFISADIADANGLFSTTPYVELSLPAAFTYYGVDVDFGGCPPKEIKVYLYNDGILKDTYTYRDLEETNVLEDEFSNFDKMRIEITKTEPYARAIINRLSFSSAAAYNVSNNSILSKQCNIEQAVKLVKVKVFSYETNSEGKPVEVDDDLYMMCDVGPKGVEKTCENPLITSVEQAMNVAAWLANYYTSNVLYSVSYRGDPRIQANDIVSLESQYLTNMQTYVESSTLSFNGAFSGTLELRRALLDGRGNTMKQIINNILFDTDTATLLYSETDTRRRYYKTENDRYFISFPTTEIQVVSEEYMRNLLGRKDIDKYIEIFGEPLEG